MEATLFQPRCIRQYSHSPAPVITIKGRRGFCRKWKVASVIDPGWGLLSQIPPFRYFLNFVALSKHTLAIVYYIYIGQVSPQLSCGDTCQIWMWFEEFNMYFCHIENFAYGEINEWSFSNPHPRQASDRTKGSFQYKSGHSKCGNYHWYKTRLPLYMHRLVLILEILILYWQGSINIIQPRVERYFLTFKVLEISKLSSNPSCFVCRISYMTQFNSLAWRWKRKLAYRYIFPCPCFIQVSL